MYMYLCVYLFYLLYFFIYYVIFNCYYFCIYVYFYTSFKHFNMVTVLYILNILLLIYLNIFYV